MTYSPRRPPESGSKPGALTQMPARGLSPEDTQRDRLEISDTLRSQGQTQDRTRARVSAHGVAGCPALALVTVSSGRVELDGTGFERASVVGTGLRLFFRRPLRGSYGARLDDQIAEPAVYFPGARTPFSVDVSARDLAGAVIDLSAGSHSFLIQVLQPLPEVF